MVFWAIAPVMADRTQATLEHRALSAGYGLSFYLEKTLTPIGIPFQVPATHQLSAAKDPEHLLRSVLFLASLSAALATAIDGPPWRSPCSFTRRSCYR